MISHALTIILNELNTHLKTAYNNTSTLLMSDGPYVKLGNLAEGLASDAAGRDMLILSLINIKEEKTLKNLANYSKNVATQKINYENPPIFLNFQLLLTATHIDYTNALLILSRAIRYFQYKNVFTNDNVNPASIKASAPQNKLDQLDTFKLVLDLYSPTIEEINYLWGTLGGKQYPFALYILRMLDLKYKAEPEIVESVKKVDVKLQTCIADVLPCTVNFKPDPPSA